MLTCQECGKIHVGKEIGSHWICHDCKYDPSQEVNEEDNTEE